DVLRGLKRIKICTGYQLDGETRDELPTEPQEIVRAQPIYEELDGWEADAGEVRDRDALPLAARKYVDRIEACRGVDMSIISVGPGRAETIMLKHPFRSGQALMFRAPVLVTAAVVLAFGLGFLFLALRGG